MSEIENCPTCYLNANTKKLTWFVEVCPKPHLLVWAKLKGFPTWPGKVMSCRDGNVDVRFFGAHDRAWVPERECFLYIPRDPNNFRSKRNDIEKCIEELEIHVDNLKQVFGQFCYPDCKIPIDPSNELKQLQIFLPQYKSYVNRTKRHKLFSVENWKIESPEKERPEETKPNDANNERIESRSLEMANDSELMEGYGTDDEAVPEIDIKSRKKLMNKSEHSDQNGDSHFQETGPIKTVSLSKYELFEKNPDPKVSSDTIDDSSRLSEKINTVDVLEDMEINLGNDKGSSCVNISRKNSFDSSDVTKSDSESNTSSRKGPVKMDVDNFEVILTSPTKLKIVDKLMKRLSDGSSEKDSEEGSPQRGVARTPSDEDEEKHIKDGRDELSPEPKQLEEPPMVYSENEFEVSEKSGVDEQSESKDRADEEGRLADTVGDPSSSFKANDDDTLAESPIDKAPTKTMEDVPERSPESLKMKIKISRSDEDTNMIEKSMACANNDTEVENVDITKNVDVESKITNAFSDEEDARKPCEHKLSENELNEVDSPISSNRLEKEVQEVTTSKLRVSSELDKKTEVSNMPHKKIILVTAQTGRESPKTSKIIQAKEPYKESKASVEKLTTKSSSKTDLEEWARKVMGMDRRSFETEDDEVLKGDKPVRSAEIEEMEDDDDDIPLARFHIDKENILKVIHSDLVKTSSISRPPEIKTSNVSSTEKTLPVVENADTPSEKAPEESVPINKSPEVNQTSIESDKMSVEAPVVKKSLPNTDLTDVLEEVSKSKNVEIVSEAESNVSEESIAAKENQPESENMSSLMVNRKRKISSEFSEIQDPEMPKLVKQDVLMVRKRKAIEEIDEKQKKARADDSEKVATKEKVNEDEEDKVTVEKATNQEGIEKAIDTLNEKEPGKDVTGRESSRKSPEKENNCSSQETIAPNLPSRKSSLQSNSSNTSNSILRIPPAPDTNLFLDEIKSEPESDSEYSIENLEAKKKYLSALNILERDSEAFQRNKDKPTEIRTRSKTEEKRERFRIVDNITKIIDDVAINYGVKNKVAAPVALPRRSLDEQPKAASTPQNTRSDSGEIFVKSFAKIVPTKPRARKSFPQSFATEAKQIQQIKLARREDIHNSAPALRKDLEAKTSNKIAKENPTVNTSASNNNSSVQQSTGSPMTVLQQLENMTGNKSYIIVTQNQDVVLLPPNKPVNYQAPPQAVMSVAPVLNSSSNSQPSYTSTNSRTPEIWKPRLENAPLASVNLTDSQNYIPFKERTKQIKLLMSDSPAATNSVTPSVSGTTTSRNQAEDEEMPLQSGSVSSNARDSLLENADNNITNGPEDFSMMQEDSNEPSQTEEDVAENPNPENTEDDEFRLINNLVPGSVAKVVHEIVQRPPPKLKPRPPGMLSTVFSEGVPSSAGTVTSKINSVAHRLSDYLRGMLIETLDDLGKTGNSEATITSLKLEIEALKHKHSIELSEIEKNMCTVLKDIQRSIVEDRERIVEQTRAACEAETIKRIEEAKSKQWCANCLKEAQFYCCWNTSYCDYPCQQKHWPQHMTKCTQSQNSTSTQSSSTTVATPAVVRPLAGQQLILRPTMAKPGTFGRVFAKPVQKVYLNRNNAAPKTLRVQSTNGSFLTVMEAPPGNYQVVSTLSPNSVVRTVNAASKKPTPTTSTITSTPAISVTKNVGQKISASAKILSHKAPVTPIYEEESD